MRLCVLCKCSARCVCFLYAFCGGFHAVQCTIRSIYLSIECPFSENSPYTSKVPLNVWRACMYARERMQPVTLCPLAWHNVHLGNMQTVKHTHTHNSVLFTLSTFTQLKCILKYRNSKHTHTHSPPNPNNIIMLSIRDEYIVIYPTWLFELLLP